MTGPVNHKSDAGSRRALRDKLRCMRREINQRQRDRFDRAIHQHLSALIESRSVSSFAAFWPFDGEPDIIPLCRQLLDKGIEIALPKISGSGNRMEFRAWQSGLTLEPNRFGIPEPGHTGRISLSSCPLLIMPLVGYDRWGNRLGLGAGYYDRHLKPIRNSPLPLRVGVAYSLQKVELPSHNDWDIPLHGVINENGWFTFP